MGQVDDDKGHGNKDHRQDRSRSQPSGDVAETAAEQLSVYQLEKGIAEKGKDDRPGQWA